MDAGIAAIDIDWELFLERLLRVDKFWDAVLTTLVIAVVVQILGTLLGLVSAFALFDGEGSAGSRGEEAISQHQGSR